MLTLLFIALIAYLILIAPNTKRGERLAPFEAQYIAHRGFFDNESERPENSMAAFSHAVENGYGIELDVQLTRDGHLVVFHDDELSRMCGVEKRLEDCTLEELQALRLAKSEQGIPLFADVLALVNGRVPLIVEIKNSERWVQTCEKTAALLDYYQGCYCVESFSPYVVEWYKKNRPNVVRGILSTDYFKDEPEMDFWQKLILTNLLFNARSKPDFVAYNHLYKNQLSYRLVRYLYGVKNVAWTIRSQKELIDARDVFTCMIFDSFTPQD